jgi:hypothetical protein
MINDGPTHILKLLDVELTDAGLYKVKKKHLKKHFFIFILIFKAVVESQISTTELISQVTVRGKFNDLNYKIFLFNINLLDVSDESSVPVEVSVSQDGSCTLECQASGTPLPEVTWTKNGKEIKANEHFVLESLPNGMHRLIIQKAQYEHAGKYVANVKHKVRTQFMNFNVTITGMFYYLFIFMKINNFIFRKKTRNISKCNY